ncbi:hypothetical protein [Sciscionella sediminilitoris]|uniref:hypothetical protein n=1 Tax=Sciscionella sediminilitoris TaxID=1445613 RepID=UPI0004DF56BD|nr:hypothetical protein [Sciscionella sp. SE31]
MKTFMKRAITVAAATAGLALLGGTASSFAATADTPDQLCSQSSSTTEGPNNGTTNSPCNVVPSYEQAHKDFIRGGTQIGKVGKLLEGKPGEALEGVGTGAGSAVAGAFTGVIANPVAEGLKAVHALVPAYPGPISVTDHQQRGNEPAPN